MQVNTCMSSSRVGDFDIAAALRMDPCPVPIGDKPIRPSRIRLARALALDNELTDCGRFLAGRPPIAFV